MSKTYIDKAMTAVEERLDIIIAMLNIGHTRSACAKATGLKPAQLFDVIRKGQHSHIETGIGQRSAQLRIEVAARSVGIASQDDDLVPQSGDHGVSGPLGHRRAPKEDRRGANGVGGQGVAGSFTQLPVVVTVVVGQHPESSPSGVSYIGL